MSPDYKSLPAWQEAHARLLDESGTEDVRLFRSISAAFDLYRLESGGGRRAD